MKRRDLTDVEVVIILFVIAAFVALILRLYVSELLNGSIIGELIEDVLPFAVALIVAVAYLSLKQRRQRLIGQNSQPEDAQF